MKIFIERDEPFICENCKLHVRKLHTSSRDHCTRCLYSKHVDKFPGDRQEQCHGKLVPISVELSAKKGYVIVYKCEKCGMIRKCKAAEDDNMDLIIELSSMPYQGQY